ncbi:MAG: GNAT family N-acetyltransferase [Lachnospiraceae bacterium]|jgi:Acetyltransferase (GNAT) family.|nr:GNAT family N-acetyltransferase [Lachnospiraceae bacterium]
MNVTNEMSAEEYLGLRKAVGWSIFPVEEAQAGLDNSYVVCIRDEDRAVAMGRIIWDHGYSVLIADIIVAPNYQGCGLGRMVMENIMDHIRSLLKPGYRIMVSLLAAQNKEEFYKKFGFIDRPNENFGCGMHQWLESHE